MLPQPSVENLAYILRYCSKEKNLAYTLRSHACMLTRGLEAHTSLGNYLVSMLVEVGRMHEAHKVFDRLASRRELSWNSLINGYIKSGESSHAFTLYQKMRENSLYPSAYTFMALLKACAHLKDVKRGCEIHADIGRKGLLKADPFVGSALVDMYAKCGSLAKAQEVFDVLPVRDVVTWTALIAGYAQYERGEEAMNCFEQMQLEGVSPNAATFVCSLKACSSIGATNKGRDIHADIETKGLLKTNQFVGNALVDMYAKCGVLEKAQELFDKLPIRDVVSWNALIGGYAEHDRGKEALICYKQMQLDGVSPNAITFACSLKACGSIGAKDKGREIHANIERKGLLSRNCFVGTALVDMYAKCGMLAKAQEVFDKFLVHDVVSWNTLIAGYAEHECGEKALSCFKQMQLEGVSPNAATFACSLKACGSIGAIDKGRELHAEIARQGLLETNQFVATALVDMYAKCGMLAKAQEVFDKLPVHDVVPWNALITGYIEHGRSEQALSCFKQMQFEGVSSNSITFACSLKACGNIGATDKGGEIHAEIARIGLLETDLVLGSMVVDMYAKCGLLAEAQEVFDKLPVRDVVTWTALIAGYVQHERGEEALDCFKEMQLEGISSDAITYTCILKACGSTGAIDKGKEIHAEIAREGLLKGDLGLGNALVDMYAEGGMLAKAQEVFDRLPIRDVVSWNVLITGYMKHERGEEALDCFKQMQLQGVSPDAITFACSLKACGSIGAKDKGREIHADIEREGLLESSLVVGTALVDMYAKCGLLAKAHDVFDKLPVRDVISWNSLITGYAQLGEIENVLNIFDRMRGEGSKPNPVTFISVLNACSHAGLVDKGQTYFKTMSENYGITPILEHHTCMIDLLGRAGQLNKAVAMIKETQSHPNIVTWLSVLGACRKWGNVELGRHAFEQALRLDEKEPAAYVCMGNIYADADMQEDA